MWLWRPDSRSSLLALSEQVSSEDEPIEEEKQGIELAASNDRDLYLRRGPHSFSISD
jgi:hypothetical protein